MSEFTTITRKLPYIILKLDHLTSTYSKYSPVITFLGMKYKLKVDCIYIPTNNETVFVITFVRIGTGTSSQFKFQMSITFTIPGCRDDDVNAGSVAVSLNDENLCILNEKLSVMRQKARVDSYERTDSITFYITTRISSKNVTMIPHTTEDDEYDWAVRLSNDFRKLVNSEEHSDILLKCGDKCFPAHRAVLSARSPVFAAMFRSDMKESREKRVDIQNIESDILEKFLHYLYSGKIPDLSIGSARKLHSIADMYQVEALKIECSFFAVEQLKKLGKKFDVPVPKISCPAKNEKSKSVSEITANDAEENEILKELFQSNEWDKLVLRNRKLAYQMCKHILFKKLA